MVQVFPLTRHKDCILTNLRGTITLYERVIMPRIEDMNFSTPPLMFAAWPGMGNVGLMAMDYLRRSLDAHLFAQLDMKPFYTPDEVIVENGLARFPEIPTSFFHEQHNPNVVLFESTMQTAGKDAMTIAQTVLTVAKKIKAPKIYTAAALPYAMTYKTPSLVFAAANNERFMQELETFGINRLTSGFISGLSGLLMGIAASQRIDAACLLATIPTYAIDIDYPKGSLAIVNALTTCTKLKVPTDELEQFVHQSEIVCEDIESRLRNLVPWLMEEEQDQPLEQENFDIQNGQFANPPSFDTEKIPEFVMSKIEQLFKEVARKKDRKKAQELKRELDKWGLYDFFEKRFLDLFKEE